MKYKAIIFDLDGTLLDTLNDIGSSVNRVLAGKGFHPHPPEKYRDFIGDGSKMLVTRAIPKAHRNENLIKTCLEAFFKDYNQNWDNVTQLYEGIPELLDELTQRGLKLAVLSNKRHDLTKKCVVKFFSKWHFDVMLGLRESVPRKPHPAGALEIATRLSLPAKKIIYAGDSGTDMETALAAGMFPVGVLWGFRPEKELKAGGARALVDHPLSLLNLLGA